MTAPSLHDPNPPGGGQGTSAGPGDAARRGAEQVGLELRNVEGVLELAVPGGPAVAAAGELLSRPRPGTGDPLWRATLAGRATVIDATAGLGADAFHLAAKGAKVVMLERSAVIVALLRNALERAASGVLGADAMEAAARLALVHGEAVELLARGAPPTGIMALAADVVYLDPMFSVTNDKAAPQKGMAVLRRLLAGAGTELAHEEELALLDAARRRAARRVVVKRGRKAAPLAGVPPSGSIQGRTVRYDLYAPL